MRNQTHPPVVDATLPLWLIAAQRYLQKRRAPVSLVVEREAFKAHLLDLEKVKLSTPAPRTWFERLLAHFVHRHLDRRIGVLEDILDLKIGAFAVVPAGDPDELQRVIEEIKEQHEKQQPRQTE